jgi:protoporphyrinogen oxidase
MKIQTLIIGGGLAGLACAKKLQTQSKAYLIVEKEAEIGGLCRSIQSRGFTFDYTGHFLHFKNPKIQQWILQQFPQGFQTRRRHAVIFSHQTYTEYPYQENNFGLPFEIIQENIHEFLNQQLLQTHRHKSGSSGHFEDWCYQNFGRGIAKNFMIPYNRKLWKFPLSQLTTHWMGRFVPQVKIHQMIKGALGQTQSSTGYNAVFFYPRSNGISALPKVLASNLSNIVTSQALVHLNVKKKKAVIANGTEIQYEFLVSSIPLPYLIEKIEGIPDTLKKQAKRLKATSVFNINFGLNIPQPIPYSWVYFPEKEFGFHRAGSVSACVTGVAPRNKSTLYVEYSYRGHQSNREQFKKDARRQLQRLHWIRSEKDIEVEVDLDLPHAYVIYDDHREKTVQHLLAWLEHYKIYSIGRYGRWEYGSMESAIAQGLEIAETIHKRSHP